MKFVLGSLISAGLNFAGNYLAHKEEQRQADQNLAFQREKLQYDKELQQQIFAREDTAVQRRAADLEAAGLSKTLAAGSGAGAGAVVHTEAPQRRASYDKLAAMLDTQQLLLNIMNLKKANADVQATNAQAELIRQQAENAQVDKLGKLQHIKLMEQEYGYKEAMNPLQLERIQLDNALSKLINPYRVEQLKNDVLLQTKDLSLKEQELELKKLEKKAREMGIKRDEVELSLSKLRYQYEDATMESRLNIVQQELLALQLTVEAKELANKLERKEVEFYEKFPVPQSVVTGVGSFAGGVLRSALAAIK